MNIKPIETHYKGYRFRSRLEARWAVFFDALGMGWEYEKEGYQFDNTYYLPDFYLPKDDCFIEIKGSQKLDSSVLRPLEVFVREIGKPLIALCGLMPLYAAYSIYPVRDGGRLTSVSIVCDKKHKDEQGLSSHLVGFLMASHAVKAKKTGEVFTGHCPCGTEECDAPNSWEEAFIAATTQRVIPVDSFNWFRAIRKAQSARFEHGENGQ